MKVFKIDLTNKKLFSYLAVFLIILGIVATTILVVGRNTFLIKAGPSSIPKNIQNTNISDSSFTVTYDTDASVIGTINFGEDSNNLDQIVLDDRDQLSQKINNYTSHSITANTLKPNTTYYYTVTSGSEAITNNGQPFEIKTGIVIANPPNSQKPVSGRVINPDGTTPSDGLVFLSIPGSQILSTLLKEDGTFTIPLNTLRNENYNDYYNLNNDSKIEIKIISNNLNSLINLSKNQLSPVPVITLSNNYDFQETVNEPKPTRSASFKDLKFPSSKTSTSNN